MGRSPQGDAHRVSDAIGNQLGPACRVGGEHDDTCNNLDSARDIAKQVAIGLRSGALVDRTLELLLFSPQLHAHIDLGIGAKPLDRSE